MPVFIEFQDGTEYTLDVVESFTPEYNSDVTINDVESGAGITDHIIRQPLKLSISGLVTDVPLSATGPYRLDSTGKHTEFRDRLYQAHQKSELVTIDAESRGFYQNMAITSIGISWGYETGVALRVSLQLQEIRIVDTQIRSRARMELRAKIERPEILARTSSPDLASTVVSDYETRARHSPTSMNGTVQTGTPNAQTLALTASAESRAGL